MSKRQLERLKKDSIQLEHLISRLTKRGQLTKATDLSVKQSFLTQTIAELSAAT